MYSKLCAGMATMILSVVTLGCSSGSYNPETKPLVSGQAPLIYAPISTQTGQATGTNQVAAQQAMVLVDESAQQLHTVDLEPFAISGSYYLPFDNSRQGVVAGPDAKYMIVVSGADFAIMRPGGYEVKNPVELQGEIKAIVYNPSSQYAVLTDSFGSIAVLQLDSEGNLLRSFLGGPVLAQGAIIDAATVTDAGELIAWLVDGQVAIANLDATLTNGAWVTETWQPQGVETPGADDDADDADGATDGDTNTDDDGMNLSRYDDEDDYDYWNDNSYNNRLAEAAAAAISTWITAVPGAPQFFMVQKDKQVMVLDRTTQSVVSQLTLDGAVAVQALGANPHVATAPANNVVEIVRPQVDGSLTETALLVSGVALQGTIVQSLIADDIVTVGFTRSWSGDAREFAPHEVVRYRLSDSLLLGSNTIDKPVRIAPAKDYMVVQYESPLGFIERRRYGRRPDTQQLKGFNLDTLRSDN